MKKLTTLRHYSYKLAPYNPIQAPKHLGRIAEFKLKEHLIVSDFIQRFKEHILSSNGLYTKADVLWILQRYLNSDMPYKGIINLIENYKEIQRKEYKRKFHIK